MAEALVAQRKRKDRRPFEERFASLVEACVADRATQALHRRMAAARLPIPTAVLQELRDRKRFGVEWATVEGLADCGWVKRGENLLVLEGTGEQRAYVASAFGSEAVRSGYKVRCFNVADLLAEWSAAIAEDRLDVFRRQLDNADLLILDDWGVEPLRAEDVLALRRILHGRQGRASVLAASPAPVEEWEDWLRGEYLAEAIARPLVNAAHRVIIDVPQLSSGF